MFKLYNNQTETVETIYATKNDTYGAPMFLVYKNHQWIWESAKYFIPVNYTYTIVPDPWDEIKESYKTV